MTDAETPILWPPDMKNWLIWKDPNAGEDWRHEEKGTTEDELVGWHHQLNGHEFEWTLGVGDGQGGLACCSPWGPRVGHNWATELNWTLLWRVLGGFSRIWGPEAWGCPPRITWKKMEPLLSLKEDAPIEGTMTKNPHRKRLGFGSQRNPGESRLCHSNCVLGQDC